MPLPAAGAALALIQQAGGAIGGMVDAIKKLPDAVRPFVDAFSNAGDRLDAAYKSLYSTIGYALEPIIIAASATVERFADAISSGMNMLRGPIEKAAGLFMGSVKPILEGFGAGAERLGQLFEKLSPLLTPLAAAFEGLGALLHVVSTVVGEVVLGIVDKLMPSGKGLADLTDKVGEAFVFLASTTLRLADFFLTMIGMEDRMKPILEALAKEREGGGRRQAKPEGYGISGVEDVYRKRLLAAAGAGGRSVQDESRDYLKELRDLAKAQLEEMKNRPDERAAKREEAAKLVLYEGEGLGAKIARKVAEALGRFGRQEERNTP
jgi:hypothetical protein